MFCNSLVFSSLEYLLRIYVANERISCGETSPKNCSRAREGVLGFWRSESRIRSDNWRNRKHPRSIFDKKNMKGFHIENQDRDRVRICRPGPKDANQIRISAKICQNEIGILNRGLCQTNLLWIFFAYSRFYSPLVGLGIWHNLLTGPV